METIHSRCAISGGGPAGIMLGYLLARSGIDVVVLEKWPDFFRDFRGDTIHPSTMEVLHELGLLDEFLKLPHNETKTITAHIGGTEVHIADFSRLPVHTQFLAFIPQWDFLNFIMGKAKAFPNFHIMMETEATDIIIENSRVIGIAAKKKEGGKEVSFEIRADLVVGADGRHSTIREKSELPIEDLGAPIDVLWFRLPRQNDHSNQSLGYVDSGKFLILIDRDTYWQCGFVIGKGDFAGIKARGLEAFRKSIAALVPFLAGAVPDIKDWDQVKLLSVAVDRLTSWYKDGLVCIGDSAHAMSPVGGVGINLAIQDAVAAANILIPAFKKGVPQMADLARIQARRESPARRTQALQVFIHKKIVAPVLKDKGRVRVPFFLKLFNVFPPLRSIPARVIGIGFRPEHIENK